MLRCLGNRKDQNLSSGHLKANIKHVGEVTDDPLAAININATPGKRIYSVSRINPLFAENAVGSAGDGEAFAAEKEASLEKDGAPPKAAGAQAQHEKSNSSGYGGSNEESGNELAYSNKSEEVTTATSSGQNSPVLKSIYFAYHDADDDGGKKKSSTSSTTTSCSSGSESAPALECDDFCIPRPIWPRFREGSFGVGRNWSREDTFLFYKDGRYFPFVAPVSLAADFSVRDLLTELLGHINDTIEGKNGLSAEEMLKHVNERIVHSLQAIRSSTEDEMKRLCVNLSNSKKVSSVVRAFSNSSGQKKGISRAPQRHHGSASSSPLSDSDEIYCLSSAATSGACSSTNSAVFDRLSLVAKKDSSDDRLGNEAAIYGTLCGVKSKLKYEEGRQCCLHEEPKPPLKKSLLLAVNDEKPSVWEQYYGVRTAIPKENVAKFPAKPSDVPMFPGGRPEADFTLDMPRSELLSKKMKADKKWRCRCRLLTTFLGLVFFLLSVMAVSLMLTRGKRMFGSMV